MPPTYSPFWKPFESLARLGAVRRNVSLGHVAVGDPTSSDATGENWVQFLDPAALHAAWSPPASSPWSAFQRPTLFAALDSLHHDAIGPWIPPGFAVNGAPRELPAWIDGRTAVLLELPGAISVAYAAMLAQRARMQPVVTFNNWPHAKEVGDAKAALGALLAYANWTHDAWDRIEGVTPPVIVLDAWRLGTRVPQPSDFDNRYYLLDSDLPSAALLAKNGIERVVYVHPPRRPDAPPEALEDLDDVNPYLVGLAKRLAVEFAEARLDGWGLSPSRPADVRLRKTPFTTTRDPSFSGFRRNAAGGFGVLVPEPSRGAYVGGLG